MEHKILIIGGGTAGIMVAAQLKRADRQLDIAILDPADYHYYQPAWTLVGANAFDYKKTQRPMSSVIPKGVTWIKEAAEKLDPDQNQVTTQSGKVITYEYMVMAPGLVMKPELIEGLPEALDKGVVCSNYTDPEHTWEVLKNFKGGNAIFTQPTTPIKCGGAPQKIAYLAADYIRKNKLADKSNVVFATPGTVIFGVPVIAKTLTKVMHRYHMHFKPFYAPVKIDADKKEVTFKYTAKNAEGCTISEGNQLGEHLEGETTVVMPFDMLHLAPPQGAPQFVADSVLSNDGGWLEVDIETLQHKNYDNIFGIGDVAALPTAKTGAAIRKQAPIVVANLQQLIKNEGITDMKYNGYSSCPLVTGYGKMVLAEFDYDQNFVPDPKLKLMGVFKSYQESWKLWLLKKYGLPYLYWNKMMKGKPV